MATHLELAELCKQRLMREIRDVLDVVVRLRVADLLVFGLARVDALENAQAPEVFERYLQALYRLRARNVVHNLAGVPCNNEHGGYAQTSERKPTGSSELCGVACATSQEADVHRNTPVFCFLPKRESLRLEESLTLALMLFGFGLPRCANFALGMLNGCGE